MRRKLIRASRISYHFLTFSAGPLHAISPRIPWPPGCPVPGRHIKTGHPERSRSWNCFSVGRFHAEREAAAQSRIARPRLSADEMWWTSEFYWHAATELGRQLAQRLPNPMFSGWEFDPGLSVRSDTYVLDGTAWKREERVPSVRHYCNQTLLLLK